jgi:flap endonuclease-1
MGIKSINKLLKAKCPDAFFSLPITAFHGKRISVDASYWMYTNMATARKEVIRKTNVAEGEPNIADIRKVWFQKAVDFILGWLANDITPVFVFDGVAHPEKAKTKEGRHNKREISRAKINALYEQLRGDILQRSPTIIEELRKELENYTDIPREEYDLFKNVVKVLGLPCVQARHDAEQLCASLCIEGNVAAVFSKDTDNLALGCPLMITGFSKTGYSYDEYNQRINHVDCVRLDKILFGLSMSHNEFVDLCIMSGCDFNTNIPGKAVYKSYDLLQQYRSIDNLPEHLDKQCLNHLRCREIFTYKSAVELSIAIKLEDDNNSAIIDNVYNVNKQAIGGARDYLELVGISGKIHNFMHYYSTLQAPSNGTIESLQLGHIPRYRPEQINTINVANSTRAKRVVLVVRPTSSVVISSAPTTAQSAQPKIILN